MAVIRLQGGSRIGVRLVLSLVAGLLALLPVGALAAETGDEKLDRLRAHSLDLVNASRAEHDLPALILSRPLNEAALVHARDMLRKDYFAHVAPDGGTARDRYLAAGGEESHIVRENIATCSGCRPADPSAVGDLHEGWMNSPGHRANILARGLSHYGFAVVHEGSRRYAVETFSGPGALPADADGDAAIDPDEQTRLAVSLVNDLRGQADAVSASRRLQDQIAEKLPRKDFDRNVLESVDPLEELAATSQWRQFQVLAGRCTGCGAKVTAADIRYFIGEWSENPRYKSVLRSGELENMALVVGADGRGSKIAIAILAGP